jgi:DNA-binding CsgD family transcriptional regulator
MNIKQETLKMAKLRDSGATCKEIGDIYGLTPYTVWQRLSRAGFIDSYRSIDLEEIGKERLENLYAVERLPLKKIAACFGVREDIIKAALILHKIPERKLLRQSGKHIDLLKKLEIGDAVQVQLTKDSDSYLYNAAKSLGIKISLQNLGGYNFKVTRVNKINNKGAPLHQRIDKKWLEELYLAEKLSIEKIAAVLGCSIMTVKAALKYNKIPKRSPRKFGGKLVDALRSLAIGEQTEISYEAKYPVTNVHSKAVSLGLRVSVKSLGGGRVRIKRIEKLDKKGVPLHQRIDKKRLEDLYLTETLPIEKIADAFDCSSITIREALKYNKIPKRPPLKLSSR